MKRIFIWISTGLIGIFLILAIKTNQQVMTFLSYESVNVVGQRDDMRTVSRETFTETLNKLALTTDSIIARRIIEPQQDGQMRFAYDIYGEGEIPDDINVASEQAILTSDLVSSYLILHHGSLNGQMLSDTIYTLGFNNVTISSDAPLNALISIAINEISIIGLSLLLLSWTAVILIYSIKNIRTAGICYMSGLGYYQILFQEIVPDIRLIVSSNLIVCLLGMITFISMHTFQTKLIVIYLIGMMIYASMLAIISIVLSLIYIISLKGVNLVEILKGKIPLKRLLLLLLIGQLSSTVVVGWTVNSLLFHYRDMRIKEEASNEWEKNQDYFQLIYSYSAAMRGEKEEQELNKKWYNFVGNMLKNDASSLFIYSALDQLYYDRMFDDEGQQVVVDEPPVIFVTPSYLKGREKGIEDSFMQEIESLSLGQFGLIIPETLSHRRQELESVIVERMSGFASVDLFPEHEHLFDVESITTVAAESKRYFIYNTNPNISVQYLDDPIVVVTTPQAMGDTPSSHLFWGVNVASSLYLRDYENIEIQLKESGLYQAVSYILNARLSYLAVLHEHRTSFVILLVGTFLGLLTSILLFDTMHLLYFEQFRRDILVKRLAGVTFWEIHQYYIFLQTIVLVMGGGIVSLISRNILISLLVPLLFAFNTLVILYAQSKRENKFAITILKGK